MEKQFPGARELSVTCVPTATSLECHNKLFPTALSLSFFSECVVRDFTGIWPNYLFINQLDIERMHEWASEWEEVLRWSHYI